MKITKKIKFDEIEKLYIDEYDFTKYIDIHYPPQLKELYINTIYCNDLNDLGKISLPLCLEKIYIHVITCKKNLYNLDCSPLLKDKFKIPFGCIIDFLPVYANPFEEMIYKTKTNEIKKEMIYWDINIKNSKFIEYTPNAKTYEIKQCIKNNKKYFIPIMIDCIDNIKLNF